MLKSPLPAIRFIEPSRQALEHFTFPNCSEPYLALEDRGRALMMPSLTFDLLLLAAGEPAGGRQSIDVVEKLMHTEGRTEGLAPFYVDPSNGMLSGGILTLGARGDSYYEYMLKQWLLSGKQQQSFLR